VGITARLAALRCVDAVKSNPLAVNFERVAIDHGCHPGNHRSELCWVSLVCFGIAPADNPVEIEWQSANQWSPAGQNDKH